jgi:hypothetical protein
MHLKFNIIPFLTLVSFGVLAQTENINQGKVKTEETTKVCVKKKKHYTYFSGNAPVTMADGSVKIMADVRVGEFVQTWRKGKSMITQVKQVDVYNYPSSSLTAVYLRPVNEVTVSASDKLVPALLLEATPYHHVQTDKGKKRIKNLSKKDVLYHYEPATGELSAWKVGVIKENARTVNKAYNLETEQGTYLVENMVVRNK